MTRGIIIAADHSVQKGTVSPLHISIDGQNGVDVLAFTVPEGMEDWAWRVEIEQNGKKTWRMMEDGHVWTVRAGEVVEGYGKIQAVASLQSGETTLCWKTREFDICVFPAINASEAVTPGEASALDEIAAQVAADAEAAAGSAQIAKEAADMLSGLDAEAETLPAGSDATVTVVDGKIVYGIPRGDTGAQGPQGERGPQGGQGPQGPAGADGVQADDTAVSTESTWSSRHIVDMLCPPLEASGNPVQCYPVSGYPLGVKASWGPRQEGSGDPSPENVRAITGLDEVRVQRCGANLLDFSKITFSQGDIDGGLVAIDYAQRKITIAANINNVGYMQSLRDIVGEVPPGTYVFDAEVSSHGAQKILYLLDTGRAITFGEPILLHDVDLNSMFSWYNSPVNPEENTISNIRFSTHAIDYSPYTGTTATLSLPSTVYGGEVDLATGKGISTWTKFTIDSESSIAKHTHTSGQTSFSIRVDNMPCKSAEEVSWLCNRLKPAVYPYAELGYSYAIGFTSARNDIRIVMEDQGTMTVEEFKAWLAENPVTIVYEVESPTQITATGSQSLPALSGENVLITNADSLTVTGRADPNHTIQTLSDRIAALESETIEGGTNA